jgi:hypothetical protein
MFASLRNKFSNYLTCSLRFDIEENIIIEDFASLRFDNLWHLPLMFLDVSALQRNVLLLEVSTLQGPELYLDVSALQRNVLLLLSFYLMCSLRFEKNFLTDGRVRFRFENRCLNIECVRFASKIIFVLSNVFASFQK